MLKNHFAAGSHHRPVSVRLIATRAVVSVVFLSLVVFASTLFPTQKTQAQQPAAWSLGTPYQAGARVSYNNATYKCLQAHTSQELWEPPNAPSLWQTESGAGTTTVVEGQPFPARYFAPYVDVMLYPTFPLAQTAASTNVKHYTLAFITAAGNTCDARWGGIIPLSDSFLVADINNLRQQQNGNIIVSFGGANGSELAQSCTSVGALQAQYRAAIDRYKLTHIDLDIEGAAVADALANDRRNKAVRALQLEAAAAGRQLHVSYTLQVMPTGLTQAGLNLLQNAAQNSVDVSTVNIMAMDYGGGVDPNRMGQNAIDAANSTIAQLQNIFPDRTTAQLRRMIGVTPMIGLNDVHPEVFTMSDAQQLLSYAQTADIGRLSMWSMTRDKQCPGSPQVSATCSGVAQQTFDFANRFKAFTSSTNNVANVSFGATSYAAAESASAVTLTIQRAGDTTQASSIGYVTNDDQRLFNCNPQTEGTANGAIKGVATARCDYSSTVGTIWFAAGETSKTISVPIADDVHIEGAETFTVSLRNPTGATLGTQVTSTVTLQDNDSNASPNPIADKSFFVRQHYLDFFGRAPSSAEVDTWTNAIGADCSLSAPDNCYDRIWVSGKGFFESQEFQQKGYFVYRFYKLLGTSRLPTYKEFIPDMVSITDTSDAQKNAYAQQFTQRADYQASYGALDNNQFVDSLIQRTGLTSLNAAQMKVDLNSGAKDRARILRDVAESAEMWQREFREAYVVMQYFGYLRRDGVPSEYRGWIDYLNANPTQWRQMTNGFLNSTEYRQRFGQP